MNTEVPEETAQAAALIALVARGDREGALALTGNALAVAAVAMLIEDVGHAAGFAGFPFDPLVIADSMALRAVGLID
jgi:hypothetical protein